MKVINHEGLDIIIEKIDPTGNSSPQKTKEMEQYAIALWKFALDHGIKPAFISILPDNDRLVIEVKGQKAKDSLIARFKQAEGYEVRQDKFILTEQQIYSKDEEYCQYELKVIPERRFTTC